MIVDKKYYYPDLNPFSSMVLLRKFYERNTLIVARDLLGKILVHETAEGTTAGKIVEAEAYIGPEDKASHAYNNRRTARTEVQYGPKGHAYVYQIYGMYYCFDATSGPIMGKPEAVLIRALEHKEGIALMIKRRGLAHGQTTNLTNGPSRLCMAMGITKKLNGTALCGPPLYIEDGEHINEEDIIKTRRVNVEYAGKWTHVPWRFFIKDNVFVSKP